MVGYRGAERAASQKVARVALGVGVAAAIAYTIWDFVPAVLWGAVLAIGVWPAYAWADDRLPRRRGGGHGRIWLPLASCLVVTLLLGLPLAAVGLQAGREAHEVTALWRRAATDGIPTPGRLATVPLVGAQAASWWEANLAHPGALVEVLGRVDRASALEVGRKVGASVAHRVELLAFALVTLFVLLREARGVRGDVEAAAQTLFGPGGATVVDQVGRAVRGAVDGLVLVGIAEGVIIGIGYAVVGVPHPTLLALTTAVGAMVPFGLIPVVAVAILLLLAKGSAAAAIGIGALALAVSFVADHFVRPKVMGSSTRLPFLWVLFGILGGVASYGLVGLFVGPTLMAVGILLWRRLVDQRRDDQYDGMLDAEGRRSAEVGYGGAVERSSHRGAAARVP